MPVSEALPQNFTGIIIAIVGLVGGVLTAIITNWDKLFRKDTVTGRFTGYQPTKHFETELRYYFEVSGTRASLESSQQQMLQIAKMQELTESPEVAEEINKRYAAIEKEAIRFEDVVKELLPVYQKYYTLDEIQELNKFYSTEAMQNMRQKGQLLVHDVAPIQLRLLEDYYRRLGERLREQK